MTPDEISALLHRVREALLNSTHQDAGELYDLLDNDTIESIAKAMRYS